jgi:hypothetical protein
VWNELANHVDKVIPNLHGIPWLQPARVDHSPKNVKDLGNNQLGRDQFITDQKLSRPVRMSASRKECSECNTRVSNDRHQSSS